MSALWAGLVASPPDRARTRLRAVAKPTPRLARIPFLLVVIGLFGLGMVGLLMLNTTLQNQAFEARGLNRQATELAYVQADLERRLDEHASPAELARVASKLGMRPNPHPAFLVLPEGRIVGKPRSVGSEQTVLVIKTPEQIAAEQAAARAKAAAAAAKAKAKAAAEKKKAATERAAAEQKKKAAEKKKKQSQGATEQDN